MGVKLVSSGGGSVEINPPATASSFTATMPAGTGNVVVNGVNGALVLGTAQNSTSGTSIDFTGIPSWVRRITVMLSGVSTNGGSSLRLQIGAGAIETSGYNGGGLIFSGTGGAVVTYPSAAGFELEGATGSRTASTVRYGPIVLMLVSGNTWLASSTLAETGTTIYDTYNGNKTLSGVLDRVRITTVNGTDTFDAGTINIMYE